MKLIFVSPETLAGKGLQQMIFLTINMFIIFSDRMIITLIAYKDRLTVHVLSPELFLENTVKRPVKS